MSAETVPDPSPQKSFADFVKEAPSVTEAFRPATVTLSGMVLRSEKEDMFILLLANGQAVELGLDAVQSYQVVSTTGGQRVVQLQVLSSALQSTQQAPASRRDLKQLLADTIKELPKESTTDKQSWNDKVLSDTSAWFDKNPTSDKNVIKDVADGRTQGWNDKILSDTSAWFDKNPTSDKNVIKDVADETQGWNDKILSDTSAWFDKNPTSDKNVIKDVADEAPPTARTLAGRQGGMVPFVLATPHHAPQAALMAQGLAGAGQGAFTLKEASGDVPKSAAKDGLQDPLTFKELIKDPLQDPMTLKELIKDPIQDPITWVESDWLRHIPLRTSVLEQVGTSLPHRQETCGAGDSNLGRSGRHKLAKPTTHACYYKHVLRGYQDDPDHFFAR